MLLAVALALACEPVEALPEQVQVAWVSPLRARVGAKEEMVVVRSAPLQAMIDRAGRDAAAVLRGLGLIGGRAEARGEWKVTVFDVPAAALCRPVADPGEGALSGVRTCAVDRLPRVKRRAWDGCGYLRDTGTGLRTLDAFLVDWGTASLNGFCLLPFRRFLDGRPR